MVAAAVQRSAGSLEDHFGSNSNLAALTGGQGGEATGHDPDAGPGADQGASFATLDGPAQRDLGVHCCHSPGLFGYTCYFVADSIQPCYSEKCNYLNRGNIEKGWGTQY